MKKQLPRTIAGYLKFSDFNKSGSNLKNHFEELLNGKLYFSPTSSFESDELSIAQQAVEGRIDDYSPNEWTSLEILETNEFTEYEIPNGVGFNGLTSRIIFGKLHVSPDPQEVIKHLLLLENVDQSDIYYRPKEYVRSINRSNGHVRYRVDTADFIINPKNNWGIASFVAIYDSDIKDGRLTQGLIEKLTNPWHGIGFNRPWVYIPNQEMGKIMFSYSYGLVNYLAPKDKYPLSRGEVMLTPYRILLYKPKRYSDQQEFRLITGGPNKKFSGPVGKVVQLNFNKNKLMFGTNTESLKKLKIP